MQIHIGLITWGPEGSEIEEFLCAATTIEAVKIRLAEELVWTYKNEPAFLGMDDNRTGGYDDLETFYDDGWVQALHEYGVLDFDRAEEYLSKFREATTAPWWTTQEVELAQ